MVSICNLNRGFMLFLLSNFVNIPILIMKVDSFECTTLMPTDNLIDLGILREHIFFRIALHFFIFQGLK